MLEDAIRLLAFGRVVARINSFRPHYHHLAGFNFSLIRRADQVESATLGGKHDSIFAPCLLLSRRH